MADLSLGTMMQIGFRLITHREEIGKLLPQISKAMAEVTRLVPQVQSLAAKIAPEFFGQKAAKEPVYNVRWLQEELRARGFDPGPIDGLMGPKTEAAIKAFQAANGLVADGWAGSATLAKLDAGRTA